MGKHCNYYALYGLLYYFASSGVNHHAVVLTVLGIQCVVGFIEMTNGGTDHHWDKILRRHQFSSKIYVHA